METLTDRQKAIAGVLVDWARKRVHGPMEDLLIEEGQLAQALGDSGWMRSNANDLGILCAYCDRKGFPLVPLLVVIPGLRKPEKTIFTHAFKATLSTAENNKRWAEELKAIKKTKKAVWDEFAESVKPEEPAKPKRTRTAAPKKTGAKKGSGPAGETPAEKAFRTF